MKGQAAMQHHISCHLSKMPLTWTIPFSSSMSSFLLSPINFQHYLKRCTNEINYAVLKMKQVQTEQILILIPALHNNFLYRVLNKKWLAQNSEARKRQHF